MNSNSQPSTEKYSVCIFNDLSRIRSVEDVKMKRKFFSLEMKNSYLEKQLEREKQNGKELKEKLTENQKTINDYRDAINAKESELLRYKTDLKRLKRLTVSNGFADIRKSLQRFVIMDETVSKRTGALAEEIKTQNWAEKDKHLENLRYVHERYNRDRCSPFINLFDTYRILRAGIRASAKNTLKIAYESAKSTGSMRERWQTFVEHLDDDLEALEKFEKTDNFPNLATLKSDFQVEALLYDEILAAAEEENIKINLGTSRNGDNSKIKQEKEEILNNGGRDERWQNNNNSVTSHVHDDPKSRKVLQKSNCINQKKQTNNTKSQELVRSNNSDFVDFLNNSNASMSQPQNGIESNANTVRKYKKFRKFRQQAGKTNTDGAPSRISSRSVILFGIAENESLDQDKEMITTFLLENNFVEERYQVSRLGEGRPNSHRPLVIKFTNDEIVDKILALKPNKGWFNGFNPGIQKFDKRRRSKSLSRTVTE
ncbi:hypothetical protein Trydic_g19441 [Trypoxylus dichotomus]